MTHRHPQEPPPTYEGTDRSLSNWVRRQRLRLDVRHVSGPTKVEYGPDELVVVCLVRDGRPYVKAFVEHYRQLGAKHIVFLDNGSTDGTVEAARKYDGVTVLWTRLPYKKYKYLMKQYLISHFGSGRWSLCVDIDELFDYPYSDVIPVGAFLRYLAAKSYTAVTGQMLDMFSDEPVLPGGSGGLDEPLKERHRFYDISDLGRTPMKGHPRLLDSVVESEDVEVFRGGVRNVVFDVRANLTKFPLVFSDGRVMPMDNSSHRVNRARIADITCVLFHYKFLDRFHEQAARAVREGNYHDDSSEYKKYLQVLEEGSELRVRRETAHEITSTIDLIDNQFLVVSEDYVKWVGEVEREALQAEAPRDLPGAFLESRQRERRAALRAQRLERLSRDRERETRLLSRRVRELERAGSSGRQARLERQVGNLRGQLEDIQNSRAWKLLNLLHRVKVMAMRLGKRR